MSLNPCFNGRYSQSVYNTRFENWQKVLILVLMEDTLRALTTSDSGDDLWVLILVLMEDTLREKSSGRRSKKLISLNPCFNGRYSQRL